MSVRSPLIEPRFPSGSTSYGRMAKDLLSTDSDRAVSDCLPYPVRNRYGRTGA
jgi:hypothetical protein